MLDASVPSSRREAQATCPAGVDAHVGSGEASLAPTDAFPQCTWPQRPGRAGSRIRTREVVASII
jgi:hypothetical protein